jgi:hypothetical protein
VGDQESGSPGRPVSSGLQVPGEPGHCPARKKAPLVNFKCHSVAQAMMSNALC